MAMGCALPINIISIDHLSRDSLVDTYSGIYKKITLSFCYFCPLFIGFLFHYPAKQHYAGNCPDP
jgi:hypothetical protein